MARRQLETAKQIVAVLGTMKGAAMKLGQVMSFLDVGPRPRGAPRGVPARARQAARRRADGVLQADAPRDRGRPRRADRRGLRVLRRGADRGGVDRPGLPRHAATDGREVAVKVQYPGVAGAVRADLQNLDMIMRAAQADDAGARREGDRRGDQGADRRGARLRARGPEPALAGAHLRRAPVHRRPRGRQLALARARARQRVRQRRRLRGAQGPPAGRARPHRRDRVPLLPRLPVPPPPVLRRPAPGQLPAARRRPHGVPGLRAVQAHGRRAGRARARRPAGGRRGRRRRRCTSCSPSRASCPNPSASTPSTCWRSSRTRSGGTRRPTKPSS